jgi:hypothetical protein
LPPTGALDQATYAALNEWLEKEAAIDVPKGTIPFIPTRPVSANDLPFQIMAPGSTPGSTPGSAANSNQGSPAIMIGVGAAALGILSQLM